MAPERLPTPISSFHPGTPLGSARTLSCKLDLAQFHYDLPEELIAQEPPAERAGARMLVVRRDE